LKFSKQIGNHELEFLMQNVRQIFMNAQLLNNAQKVQERDARNDAITNCCWQQNKKSENKNPHTFSCSGLAVGFCYGV